MTVRYAWPLALLWVGPAALAGEDKGVEWTRVGVVPLAEGVAEAAASEAAQATGQQPAPARKPVMVGVAGAPQ